MSFVKHFRELDVYQNALNLAMKVFELTKCWPSDERFNLTDQIRRSSRSVCTNLAEAWRKRRYQAAFIAKLSDSETEAAGTQVSAELAMRCRFWDEKAFCEIDSAYEKMLGQIVKMASQPEKWLIRQTETKRRSVTVSESKSGRAPNSPTLRHPDPTSQIL
jgi:four helix bundle protein